MPLFGSKIPKLLKNEDIFGLRMRFIATGEKPQIRQEAAQALTTLGVKYASDPDRYSLQLSEVMNEFLDALGSSDMYAEASEGLAAICKTLSTDLKAKISPMGQKRFEIIQFKMAQGMATLDSGRSFAIAKAFGHMGIPALGTFLRQMNSDDDQLRSVGVSILSTVLIAADDPSLRSYLREKIEPFANDADPTIRKSAQSALENT